MSYLVHHASFLFREEERLKKEAEGQETWRQEEEDNRARLALEIKFFRSSWRLLPRCAGPQNSP